MINNYKIFFQVKYLILILFSLIPKVVTVFTLSKFHPTHGVISSELRNAVSNYPPAFLIVSNFPPRATGHGRSTCRTWPQNPHIRQHVWNYLSILAVDVLILQPGLAEPCSHFSQFQVAFHLNISIEFHPLLNLGVFLHHQGFAPSPVEPHFCFYYVFKNLIRDYVGSPW